MTRLRRFGSAVERWWERLMPGRGREPLLDPYRGFATPDHLVVRGRVLTALRRTRPEPEHSWWTNLRQMVSLFLTNEVAGVPVAAGAGVTARSDPEGYLWIEVPRGTPEPGWRTVDVEIAGRRESRRAFPVLVPDPAARLGVISDIDDTLMQTGAYSLARNLWTTFTGSALTRHIFPDAVELVRELHAGVNPIFYVSSSPWNLHHFLDRVFGRSGLVPGPMFLRDLGLSGTPGHRGHKGAAIDRIFAANPGLRFVLAGDTGQKDAFVYRDAIARHPGRVLGVILREPGVGAPRASLAAIAEIEAGGVPVHHAPDFSGVETARLLADAGAGRSA